MKKYEVIPRKSSRPWLLWLLRGILVLGFLVLIARTFELQVIKGVYYRNLAEGNRIRRVRITAPRGRIIARGGEIIVGNRGVQKKVIFDKHAGYKKTQDVSGALSEEIILEWERDYLLADSLAHVSGYLGEINESELDRVSADCSAKGARKLGTLIGRSGLEELYDCNLRGIDGEKLIEVDTSGEIVRVLGEKESTPGADLHTSIHVGLQKQVSEIMQDGLGAIIVSDVNGEVLALYSSPSFNPNIFVSGTRTDLVEKTLNDETLPLFNRVIGGKFHPGSVIKPIIAIAALEEDKIDENFVYNDPGQITIKTIYGDFSYSNWYFTQYGAKEGEINLPRAIARSTDTFFYKVGELVGVDRLVFWLRKFGLNQKTGVDLPGEITGLVPDPIWKQKVKGERWFLGNTYHLAIGQGDVALTPIGLNSAIAAIASGGRYCPPKLAGESQCIELNINKKKLRASYRRNETGLPERGNRFYLF